MENGIILFVAAKIHDFWLFVREYMSCFNGYAGVWNVPDKGHVIRLHESYINKFS